MKNQIFLKKPTALFTAFLLFLTLLPLLHQAQAAGAWQQVGTAGFSAGRAYYTSLAFDSSNTPYVAYQDRTNSSKASVMKFNGSSWQQVGTAGFSAGRAIYISLTIDSTNTPYVAYQDAANSYKASVMKFNGSSWQQVGTAGFTAGTAGHTSLAFDSSNTPYVAYKDAANSNKASVMKFNGSSWEQVGTAGFSAGDALYTSLAFDSSNTPYVAYQDRTNSSKASVMKFNGSSWEQVGTAGFSAGWAYNTSLAFDSSDTPYVAYRDYVNSSKASVMKFNGSSWQQVGTAGFSAGIADYTSLAFDSSNTPYVAYRDYVNLYKASVMKFDVNIPPTLSSTSSTASTITTANRSSFPLICSGITDPDTQTLTVEYSFDNTNWYNLGSTVQAPRSNYTHTANIDLETVNPADYADDGNKTIYCRVSDGEATSSAVSMNITKDTTPPTSGSITYSTTQFNTLTAERTVTVNDGTDSGSGIDTSSRILERAVADFSLATLTCSSYSAFSPTSYTGTYPNLTDSGSIEDDKCYKYRWRVSDQVGNEAVYTSDQEYIINTLNNYLQITGPSRFHASEEQNILITAKDTEGNIDTDFTGLKELIFQGPGSITGLDPTIIDHSTANEIAFGSPVRLNFVNGQAEATIKLPKIETTQIDAGVTSDSLTIDGVSTLADAAWDLDLEVKANIQVYIGSNPQSPGGLVEIELVAQDEYGNPLDSATVTMETAVDSANYHSSLPVTNNNDGTYTASYTAFNLGTDKLVVTFNGTNPLFDPFLEIIIAECVAQRDYSLDAAVEIDLNSSDLGEARLEYCTNEITVNQDQDLDLTAGLISSSDLSPSVEGVSIAEKLQESAELKQVTLKVGSNSEADSLIIDSQNAGVIEIPSGTTLYSSISWDGKLMQLQDTTESRMGFLPEENLKVGRSKKSILFDQPVKITLPSTLGDPCYSVNQINWVDIKRCDNATRLSPDPGLTFPSECYLEDGGETIIWTYHFTNFGSMTSNGEIIMSNNEPDSSPGPTTINFTSGPEIPASGIINLTFPDEFTLDNIPDLLNDGGINRITSLTSGGLNILSTVTAASLDNNVISLTFDTLIPADSALSINLDATVIDQNPNKSGQYGVQLLSANSTGEALGTGIIYALIGDGVGIEAEVIEDLSLTISPTSLNLLVDAVSGQGRDITQSTQLHISTNAANYNIQTKLVNAVNNNASLYNQEANAEILSTTYAAASNNTNYFAFSLNEPLSVTQFANRSFSSTGQSLFEYPQTGITNSTIHSIYYDFNIDYQAKGGNYQGVIYFTAVPTF
jgi:hypothetical protein